MAGTNRRKKVGRVAAVSRVKLPLRSTPPRAVSRHSHFRSLPQWDSGYWSDRLECRNAFREIRGVVPFSLMSQEAGRDSFQSSKSSQKKLRMCFLENGSIEFFYKMPTCSPMNVVFGVIVLSILFGSLICNESAIVAFIFP